MSITTAMPPIMFIPAEREAFYLRMALTGPAGAGKTCTGLALLTNMCERVAAVDTHHGRIKEYAADYKFDAFCPERFDPRDMPRIVGAVTKAGYDGLLIDSGSSYWDGPDGALAFVDTNTEQNGSKFSQGWNKYRPIEMEMWEALRGYEGHLIMTLRVKMGYEIVFVDGKAKPTKVGMKPIQRDGVEHDFAVLGDIDETHTLTVSKTTCKDLVDQRIHKPGAELAATLLAWCRDGKTVATANTFRDQLVDKHITWPEVVAIRDKVATALLGGAIVENGYGDMVRLEQLVYDRGREVHAAEKAAASNGNLIGAAT